MILFLFVIFCAWKFPPNLSQSPHPKHWHLRVYCHGSFGLAKASKVRAATWHMIWNSTMARNAGIDFLYPGDENQLFSMPKKNMARFANSDCCWHILLDVKIDLVPNLHSVAKSAGSWVQEKIERDTAALNLHSFTHGMPLVHWSNIITSVHRPPQKPKRFRVEMAIEVIPIVIHHGSSQTSHLQPPGPGRPSWPYCGCQSSWYRRKTIEIHETYRNIWIWSIDIDIYILYVTLRWLVSSPIWCKTRDAHHGFSPLHDPWRSFLAVGLDFEEYVTQVWKLWINHRPYEDFVYSLINYIQLFEN